MSVRVCRWGIMGTATISRKNWQAIARSGIGCVTAVASRNLDRCRQFIQDCQAHLPIAPEPRAYGSYEALLADPDVDAVYIPLPTGLRKKWVILAAQHGKHVVCEKPCAVSSEELQEMIDACHDNQVQFMDGVMYMHSKRMAAMRKVLDDQKAIGTIRRIATQFSFNAPDAFYLNNIRANAELEPYGCLGDLGWYTIRFALWVMNFEMPVEVRGRVFNWSQPENPNDAVPLEFSGELLFESGVSCSLYNSFMTEHQQWAHVSGTKGYLHVSDFVLPFYGNTSQFELCQCVFNPTGWDFNMERYARMITTAEYSNAAVNSSETNLFRNFGEIVLTKQLDNFWPQIALKTQIVMDACLRSARNDAQPQLIQAPVSSTI